MSNLDERVILFLEMCVMATIIKVQVANIQILFHL